jgi:hypothetical protein
MSAELDAAARERIAAQAVINRLLDTHATLAAAGAVAATNRLTRCADSLSRQRLAVAHEIQTLVADLLYPTTVANEARR